MTSSPQQPDKIPVSVYLTHDIKARLEERAKLNGRTLSSEMRRTLEESLDPPERNQTIVFKTLAQSEAKRATYEILKRADLPIPPDLRDEIERGLDEG